MVSRCTAELCGGGVRMELVGMVSGCGLEQKVGEVLESLYYHPLSVQTYLWVLLHPYLKPRPSFCKHWASHFGEVVLSSEY